jgi:hypothetical protein
VGKAAGRERVRRRAHQSSAKKFDSKNGGTAPIAPLPTLRTGFACRQLTMPGMQNERWT